MTIVMIDSSAWIELIDGTKTGLLVQEYLDRYECVTPSIVVAEVCSKAKRKGSFEDVVFGALATKPIISLSAQTARSAGLLHAQHHGKNGKFSIVDAVILATAREMKAKILTKDSDFRNIPEAILLK